MIISGMNIKMLRIFNYKINFHNKPTNKIIVIINKSRNN